MPNPAANLLLTGISGVGKSTALKRAGLNLSYALNVKGFHADVISDGDKRVGWRLDTFDGTDGGVLIHLDIDSPRRMGRYGVDMTLFERLVESQMELSSVADVYLIDEIGIVAPWSESFIKSMNAILDSNAPSVAIVRARGEGYVQQVKNRPDVELWEVTLDNRDSIPSMIGEWVRERTV